MKNYFQRLWPYVAIFVLFIGMACIYMSPELEGKKIGAFDNVQAISAMHETITANEQTGKGNWWNGSMFCGMPNYQIGGTAYMVGAWSDPLIDNLHRGYDSPIFLVLLYLGCFFILMLSMRMGKWLSVVGAIAMTFSSYFIIIVGTSHVTKATSIALMTLALAGFYLIFNKYRKTGICLCMIGTLTGFDPHPQMTYYIGFIFAAFGLAELYKTIKSKEWKAFAINCLLALGSLAIGIGTTIAPTLVNSEYVKETIRGGMSDLGPAPTDSVAANQGSQPTDGLDYKYATEYSYGIDESLTLLIPNYMGGSSQYALNLSDAEVNRLVEKGVNYNSIMSFSSGAPTYWGKQTNTSGPVYIGAIILFLFVLGLFIVKGPYKWALAVMTLLSLVLSWGDNFEWFNKLVFDYFPFYNKFRAVASILVIAEITTPIIAIMALRDLKDMLAKENADKARLRKYVFISAGITAGFCLAAYAIVSMSASFLGPNELLTNPDGSTNLQVSELVRQRQMMFSSDVWRSIGLILAAAVAILLYIYGKMRHWAMYLTMGAMVLFDLWAVDKRYTNDKVFSTPEDYSAAFDMLPWEKHILDHDSTPSFRIANVAAAEIGEARTAYRLKNVSGYHAAKLRRYNDIANEHLAKGHEQVFNMLNTKYVIDKAPDKDTIVVYTDPKAFGNAWFVEKIQPVNTPREECDGLNKYDLSTTAIVGKDFASHVKNMNPGRDSLASITMTKYQPDDLFYDAKCSKPGTIVFSEVYYPYGWKAYVDDKEVDLYRVNYLLRAINIEPGEHKIRMEFRPETLELGNNIAMTCQKLLYAIMAICVALGFWEFFRRKPAQAPAPLPEQPEQPEQPVQPKAPRPQNFKKRKR